MIVYICNHCSEGWLQTTHGSYTSPLITKQKMPWNTTSAVFHDHKIVYRLYLLDADFGFYDIYDAHNVVMAFFIRFSFSHNAQQRFCSAWAHQNASFA